MKAISSVSDLLDKKGRHVHATSPDATLTQCAKLMSEKGVSSLILETPKGGLAGLLTSRDLLTAASGGGARLDSMRAEEVMAKNLRTVSEDAGIEEAEQLMLAHQIRHLPVLRAGKVVGLLSRIDVLRHYLDKQHALSAELERYITGGA